MNESSSGPIGPITFQLAERRKVPIKLAIAGVSGSGKTYSSILLAHGLAGNDPRKILVIDTENESAALYSHLGGGFLHYSLRPPFEPRAYCQVIREAVRAGVGVIVIDSLTHAWRYILDFKDRLDRAAPRDSYTNWGKAKALFAELKDTILQSPVHVIVCMRSKADYVIEERQGSSGSRSTMKKVGMSPILEPDAEYDFSVLFEIDKDTHQASVGGGGKDRTDLFGGRTFTIDQSVGQMILEWLGAKPGDTLVAGENWNAIQAGESAEFRQAQDQASFDQVQIPAESATQRLDRIVGHDDRKSYIDRAIANQVSWSKVIMALEPSADTAAAWLALEDAIWSRILASNFTATVAELASAMDLTDEQMADIGEMARAAGVDRVQMLTMIARGGGRCYDDVIRWWESEQLALANPAPAPAPKRKRRPAGTLVGTE